MDAKTITRIIIGAIIVVSCVLLCKGCRNDRTAGDAKHSEAVAVAKQQFNGNYKVATEGVGTVTGYNSELETYQRETSRLLRELEQRLDAAIKARTQETERK